MEFTNQLKKYVRFLHQRKHRQKYNKFVAEGPKICTEFLVSNAYEPEYIFATENWLLGNEHLARKLASNRIIKVKQKDLDQISLLKTANQVLLIADQNSTHRIPQESPWSIYLDRIQDPGNMGAILRIADWYKILNVYASPESVEYYNPKVIQSAMGAHTRLSLLIEDFESVTSDSFGLCLDGAPISTFTNHTGGTIVIGNESKGISPAIKEGLAHKVTIPRYGGAESLNAAVACGIACHCLISKS